MTGILSWPLTTWEQPFYFVPSCKTFRSTLSCQGRSKSSLTSERQFSIRLQLSKRSHYLFLLAVWNVSKNWNSHPSLIRSSFLIDSHERVHFKNVESIHFYASLDLNQSMLWWMLNTWIKLVSGITLSSVTTDGKRAILYWLTGWQDGVTAWDVLYFFITLEEIDSRPSYW